MSDHMQQARWCLYCDSATHFSHECRSTHGINTPQAVELHRLLAERAALAARVGVLEGAQGVFERAADMLTAYAELIRRAGADRITDHHYLPEVEYVAKTLREAAPEPAPFVPDDSPSVPVEAAPETPAEPVAQEPRALADLPDSLRCHPGVKAAIAAARAEGAEQMRDVLQRCVKGIDHLSELARLWEPDHSSGADRRGWVLAKDARDDAAELLRSLPVEAPNVGIQRRP